MRNKFALVVVCITLLTCVLGCGLLNRSSEKGKKTSTASNNSPNDKTVTDTSSDTATDETTGIPECDEALDMISAEANNPDDGYIVKAGKAVFLNRIKESIRKSIEENKNNNGTEQLTKTCTDFKKQLEKYKAEAEKKQTDHQ